MGSVCLFGGYEKLFEVFKNNLDIFVMPGHIRF